MPSRCVFCSSSVALALCLAMAPAASAGPFTRTKLGDDLGGGGGQPAEPAAPSSDDGSGGGSRFELAAALAGGFPIGDYGDAVGTGFGLSAYGGFVLDSSAALRIAVGPALAYQSYSAKGFDAGGAGLLDITAQARAEYDVPAAPGLTLFGDLGLGLGMFMVSIDGGGGETQTHVGAFALGAGAAYHVMPRFALTGELAYQMTPTDGDTASRIALAIGGSYAY